MTNPLIRLGQLGQSPWYDYMTRELVASGTLGRLVREDGLLGMTSNPTIFEKAIAASADYDDDIRIAATEGADPPAIFEKLAVADVRAACDVLMPVYQSTGFRDGLVSLEVSPTLANDTRATVTEAKRLWDAVGRPNAMIKIPGTLAGLPAITECLAAGVNINITLLFAVARYEMVMEAFFAGLEARLAAGYSIDRIASVASFFVSRVDGRADGLLDQIGDPKGLRGTIAIANAGCAYAAFQGSLATPRWQALAARGAHPQRPLWASTSTKDPRYPDIYYVEALIAADTVDTMPPDTLNAYRDHGSPMVRIDEAIAAAGDRLTALRDCGIDLDDITGFLETDGVAKFTASYQSLVRGIESKAGLLVGR